MEDIITRLDALGCSRISFTEEVYNILNRWCESYIRIFCSADEIGEELEEIRDDLICAKLIERAVLNGDIQDSENADGISGITEGDFSIKFSADSSEKERAKEISGELFKNIRERLLAYRRIKWN